MTAPSDQLRPALLPARERSRAVLVGSSFGLGSSAAADVTRRLATEALTSEGSGGGAFRRENTTLLLDPERPADVLGAVRHAAEAASDVLLFQFAGKDFYHEERLFLGVGGTDPCRLEDTGVSLEAVADIMSASQAARLVVILECGYPDVAASALATTAPRVSVLAGPLSFGFSDDPFTETLVRGLVKGVQGGPEVLDLLTLKNAMEGAYAETRYCVENEYIGAPSRVVLRGGGDVALGVNPAFGAPKGNGALPPHPDAVDDWWLGD
ncbi:hypothetical protein EJ357_42140 [Streptomyces cyaneochromogenes]|uniref:Uncharacterized protein n=1 Tax=Streptomyces cyaneochromogenes TaxID=2496836 RepID=A0A3S9MJA7_9ACTN|nr:hypothetical protein [Streptomyces cyaneochromogenes]AZQ39231.1 hypothetical protein EJ357_42140 [Streptomyces cyaneochromogenes]